MTESDDNPFNFLSALLDSSVELYLAFVIAPFVRYHEIFYSRLNTFLRGGIDARGLPKWCTANFITYFRTLLIVPCLMLMAWGHRVIPSLIVLFVDIGDFLDGVVARYWVDKTKEAEKKSKSKKKAVDKSSDEEGFEVVTTGSPRSVSSWISNHRNRTYGGFIDAICDKAFIVPCWIYLLSMVEGTPLTVVQYIVLWILILTEVASGTIRFMAFYTSGGVPTPSVVNFNFSSSAVKADHVGKAKQTFEMIGTTFFIFPYLRLLGLFILIPAIPLAYESVRRKIVNRVIYVDGTVEKLDHRVLKFWMQARGLGSKLVVGVASGDNATEKVLNACAVSCVDEVISEAPAKIDAEFLEKHKIDYLICQAGKSGIAEEDILEAKRCLAIGEDGEARPVEAKGARKE